MKKTIFLLATILIFTISSCKKDDANADAKFSVKQKATTLKSVQTGTFSFSKALVGVSEIDFETETGTEDQDFEYEGLYQFNVLTGTSTPAISPVVITPGTYHELEVGIDNVLTSGKSIEISGTYTDGTSYQFEFTSTLEEDYDIENAVGINATVGQTTDFVLELDLVPLFNGVDFSKAVRDSDNIIRINSASNSNLASIIENNFDVIMNFDND